MPGHDIRSHAFFAFGFLSDTEESIRELINFAADLDPDFFDFNVAFPAGYGTGPSGYGKGLVIKERLRNGGYAVGAVATETLSAEELEAWRRRALWRMYLRPHYIFRTFKNAGSPAIMLNYLRAAAGRACNLAFPSRGKEVETARAAGT